MILVEMGGRTSRVQVDAADHFLEYCQRHTQHRADLGTHHALHCAQPAAAWKLRSQNCDPLFEHLACDGPADPHRLCALRQVMARENGVEPLAALAVQQDCASLRWSYFKYQVQDLPLQLLQVPNGMHHTADLEQRVQVSSHP